MSGITANDLLSIGGYNGAAQPSLPWYLDSGASRNGYWSDLLSAVEGNINEMISNLQPALSASWTGTAAELASGKITTTATSLIHTQGQLTQVRDALSNFWNKLQTYGNELVSAWTAASGLSDGYFNVENDGSLTYQSDPFNSPLSPTPMGVATDMFNGDWANSYDLNDTGPVPAQYLINIENAAASARAAGPPHVDYTESLTGDGTPTIYGGSAAHQQLFLQTLKDLASAIEAWRQEASSQFQHLVGLANQADSDTATELSKLMPADQEQDYQDMLQWGAMMNSQSQAAPATSSPTGDTSAVWPRKI
jgi:hypothetical protein